MQALVLQRRLALAELVEPEREDRLEQPAVRLIEQPQPTGVVEICRLAIKLDRHLVLVSLAATQFDRAAVAQFQRRNARHLTLAAKVVGRPRGEVEQQPAQKFEQRRFACLIRSVDDLQPVAGEDEIALGEVAEAVDVQLPDLHVGVSLSWDRRISVPARRATEGSPRREPWGG